MSKPEPEVQERSPCLSWRLEDLREAAFLVSRGVREIACVGIMRGELDGWQARARLEAAAIDGSIPFLGRVKCLDDTAPLEGCP